MPKIAIITRTLNRPLLLERAARSIINQTFRDFVWVIVNDGEQKPDDAIISDFPQDKIFMIRNSQPVGMEAAANMGLKASKSEYVIIHDDDDSWHPEFLEKTTSYLDKLSPSNIQKGVITHNMVKTEIIEGNKIKLISKQPFNTWLTEVSLYRMLAGNTFPPISFLYRRKVLEEIGYYDECLPVLGDWDFNIRFLMKYDIGLIPEVLAYTHQRAGFLTNTDVGRNESHKYYDNLLRNRYLRKDIGNGTIGVGYYMNVVRELTFPSFKHEIDNIKSWTNILPSFIRKFLDKLKKRN